MLFGVLLGGGEGLAITQNIFRQRGMVCLINVDTLKASLHNFGANISKFHFFFPLVNTQIGPDDAQ